MIAIYTRVSSKSQDAASQEPDLKRWADAQSESVEWYRDKFTGRSMVRPGWDHLWAKVLAARVDRIAIWRLDRLGRTASGLTSLFDELVARNVTLVSLREGFDLRTPAGKLLAGVLASVAQYETEVRSERQIAGIAAAKERGVTFGRPKGTGRPLRVDPATRAEVLRMKGEGRNVSEIARVTTLSRTTVYAILGPD